MGMGTKTLFFLILNPVVFFVAFSSFNPLVLSTAEIFEDEDGPLVTISNGVLKGTWQISRDTEFNTARNFSSFEGIPYAKATRFQPPEPADDWNGTLDATAPGNVCPQMDGLNGNIYLEEECLFVNVYIPLLDFKTKLPVMVYIHGGSFIEGAGSYQGPKYLMEQDIILVTLNYRLGALGFLSTEDGVVGGNMGLKDMIMALKWVQKNIGEFGGDSDNVTIFGESAGGAAVHILMISPIAKGLFHKVISQSATGLCSACLNYDPKEVAVKLANEFSCVVENSTVMVECLKEMSVKDILLAQKKIAAAFGPTLDANANDFSVLPDTPRNLVTKPLKNSSSELPFVVGWNEKEALLTAAKIVTTPLLLESLNKNWNETLPTLLNYRSLVDPEDLDRVSTDIRKFYLKDTEVITKENLGDLTNLFSDNFIKEIRRTALLQSEYNVHIYPYELTYRGNYSVANYFGVYGEGPCHIDELQYLFPELLDPVKTWPDLIEGSEDEEFSTNMIELWTSFARTGKPEAAAWKETWKPILSGDIKNSSDVGTVLGWYNLNNDSKLIMEELDVVKRMEFWETVFIKKSSGSVISQLSVFNYLAIVVSLFVAKICN